MTFVRRWGETNGRAVLSCLKMAVDKLKTTTGSNLPEYFMSVVPNTISDDQSSTSEFQSDHTIPSRSNLMTFFHSNSFLRASPRSARTSQALSSIKRRTPPRSTHDLVPRIHPRSFEFYPSCPSTSSHLRFGTSKLLSHSSNGKPPESSTSSFDCEYDYNHCKDQNPIIPPRRNS